MERLGDESGLSAVIFTEIAPFSISEEEQRKYFEEKTASIASGEPTWFVRNFDADSGRVSDYYVDGKYVGSIERGDEIDGYDAYFVGNHTPVYMEFNNLSGASSWLDEQRLGSIGFLDRGDTQ